MLLKHSSCKKRGVVHEQTCNMEHSAMWCCFLGGVFLFLFLVTACHYLDYSASQ